jgi:hypothetical protein
MSEEINLRIDGICSVFIRKCATPDVECVECSQYQEVTRNYARQQDESARGDDWLDED